MARSYSDLETLTFQELKDLALIMDLPPKKTKAELAEDIAASFTDLDRHRRHTIDKYETHEQLGEKGKEGTTFRVTRNGTDYAMKTFKKTKSSDALRTEVAFQEKAARAGVAPEVVDHDTFSKYIVMEKMDTHLVDVMKKQKGELLKYQQLRIIDLFKRLDDAGVFHGDSNIMNYMLKGRDIYLIDFGFAKEINDKLINKLDTGHPNHRFMTLGLIRKLKELGCSESSYKYLLREVREKDLEKYSL